MAERIIDMPDDCLDEWQNAYYPDERHDPMPIGELIVRCSDCRYYDEIIHACDHPCVTPLRGDCPENWIFSCFDNDFCCWGKRKEVDA